MRLVRLPPVLDNPTVKEYLKACKEGKDSRPTVNYPDLSPEHEKELLKRWNDNKEKLDKLRAEAIRNEGLKGSELTERQIEYCKKTLNHLSDTHPLSKAYPRGSDIEILSVDIGKYNYNHRMIINSKFQGEIHETWIVREESFDDFF